MCDLTRLSFISYFPVSHHHRELLEDTAEKYSPGRAVTEVCALNHFRHTAFYANFGKTDGPRVRPMHARQVRPWSVLVAGVKGAQFRRTQIADLRELLHPHAADTVEIKGRRCERRLYVLEQGQTPAVP